MATTLPTSFPTPRLADQFTTTPPNSQGYQQYPQLYSQQYPSQFPQQYPQPSIRSPLGYPPQYPPMDPNTPLNMSPSSPHASSQLSPLATRQLRPPKTPMYVPAALRPTERPPRASPLTPPRSVHGSTDSLDGAESRQPMSLRSNTDSRKQASLSKVSENGQLQASEQAVPTADLPEVTGPPTRGHWKPDAHASICDAPVCQKSFGLFERRHHCRHCGNVFCGKHSEWQLPLDQDGNYHPNGGLYRACGHCWGMYGKWKEDRVEAAARGESLAPGTPAKAVGTGIGKSADDKRGSVAASLTREWNWSTF